jgi:hypothetical protein
MWRARGGSLRRLEVGDGRGVSRFEGTDMGISVLSGMSQMSCEMKTGDGTRYQLVQ